MRVSTYEIILPLIGTDDKEIPGKALLVNGLYSAVDVVDSEIAENLEKGEFTEIPVAVRESLMERGHITRKDEEGELADARLLGRVWSKLVGYSGAGPVILPTYDCNFRCPYCFERHRLTRGQEWLGHEMKPEMVEAVFAALKKQQEKGRRVDGLSLYGGEPFLKENKETVRNICEHAKAMGLPISAVTNGYDLEDYIDLLEEFEIGRVQITVDGVGEMNDRRRRHRDGVPTYDRILKNVALALEHGIDVSLRVNTNGENIGGIKALIDDLPARGLKEAAREEKEKANKEAMEAKKAGKPRPKRKGFFSYYFKAVTEAKDSPTRVTERQVLDAIIEAGFSPLEAFERQSQYSMLMQGLKAAMAKQDYPKFAPAFCGAEQGMMVIAPDGLLYPCWDLVAMEEEAVGFTDVEAGRFFFNFGKAKWRTRTSDLLEKCRTCPYIFICRGGCAAAAKMENGSYYREACSEWKEIFAYVAPRVVGEQWEELQETDANVASRSCVRTSASCASEDANVASRSCVRTSASCASELSISLAGPLSRLTEAERETLMKTASQQEMFDIIKEAGLFMSEAGEKAEKKE